MWKGKKEDGTEEEGVSGKGGKSPNARFFPKRAFQS